MAEEKIELVLYKYRQSNQIKLILIDRCHKKLTIPLPQRKTSKVFPGY